MRSDRLDYSTYIYKIFNYFNQYYYYLLDLTMNTLTLIVICLLVMSFNALHLEDGYEDKWWLNVPKLLDH